MSRDSTDSTTDTMPGPVDHTTRASTDQVLEGYKLNAPNVGERCTHCGRSLREGQEVVFVGFQPYGEDNWGVRELYCQECSPDEIRHPQRGINEVLASAYLGSTTRSDLQTGWLSLNHVVILDVSPSERGA